MTDIALVVFDTLRYDTFQSYFDWLPGRQYTNAWAPSHWTVPVHGSMFTGRYPSEIGVMGQCPALDCDDRVLAELLSENGYETVAFTNNLNLQASRGYDRGFDQFNGGWRWQAMQPDVFDWEKTLSGTDWRRPKKLAMTMYKMLSSEADKKRSTMWLFNRLRRKLGGGPFSDSGLRQTQQWVQNVINRSSDQFLFINLMEAHYPYDPTIENVRTGYDDNFSSPIEETIARTNHDQEAWLSAYEAAVSYLSRGFRSIFEQLQSAFDVIICCADHGELFGEYDIWGHGYGLAPELTHVPLVVWEKNQSESEPVDRPVSLFDIFETITGIAGIDADRRGINLLKVDNDNNPDRDATQNTSKEEVPNNRTLLTEYHGQTSVSQMETLLAAGVDQETIEAYDEWEYGIVTVDGYGYESRDGFVTPDDVADSVVREQLADARDNLTPPPVTQPCDGETPTTNEHLEALGYL